ncbi:hypothetical protein OHA00_33460 (plasmid) [Streptomyces cellulosae]|jgi:hypothetical protein|nr:hypothetical protein OHA00_33500 [Streptomyces cellulosae]WSB52277.1 hypothetical protein OHA00_33460 [Streptomyces cellulosae]
MALAYLLSVVTALVALAVAMRPRQAAGPTPPLPPAPAPAPAVAVDPGSEVRVILAAAHQLADRLATAA